jgi:ethanolamine utilization protein EutN
VILGRVVGEVWATRKHPGLARVKLLIVAPYAWYDPAHEVDHLVAVDTVGAGAGEDVVVCLGDPARRCLGRANLPVEAAVMAIVDRVGLSAAAAAGPPRFAFRAGRAPAHAEWTP